MRIGVFLDWSFAMTPHSSRSVARETKRAAPRRGSAALFMLREDSAHSRLIDLGSSRLGLRGLLGSRGLGLVLLGRSASLLSLRHRLVLVVQGLGVDLELGGTDLLGVDHQAGAPGRRHDVA